MMKKFFAFFVVAACTVSAWATAYTGQLEVVVNGSKSTQGTTISVDKANDTYNLSIKNFMLVDEECGQKMPVGTIQLNGCKGTTANGITTIQFNDNVTILPGDDPEVGSSEWLGPMLGSVPIEMEAKLNDQVLSVDISINLALLGQVIAVKFVGNTPMGDVNGDGELNVADVTSLVNLILAN